MESKICKACKTLNPVKANYCIQCGVKFPQHTKPSKEHMCHIDSFTVRRMPKGLLLEWVAVNADKILLNGVDMTGKTSHKITPEGEQHYVLRADNDLSFDVEHLHLFSGKEVIYRERIDDSGDGRKGRIWIAILSTALILSMAATVYLYLYNNWSL